MHSVSNLDAKFRLKLERASTQLSTRGGAIESGLRCSQARPSKRVQRFVCLRRLCLPNEGRSVSQSQCPLLTMLVVAIGPCRDRVFVLNSTIAVRNRSTYGVPTVGSWPPKSPQRSPMLGAGAPAPNIGDVCGDLGGQLSTVGTRVGFSAKNRSQQGPVATTKIVTV